VDVALCCGSDLLASMAMPGVWDQKVVSFRIFSKHPHICQFDVFSTHKHCVFPNSYSPSFSLNFMSSSSLESAGAVSVVKSKSSFDYNLLLATLLDVLRTTSCYASIETGLWLHRLAVTLTCSPARFRPPWCAKTLVITFAIISEAASWCLQVVFFLCLFQC
jgi:hypothetical protein